METDTQAADRSPRILEKPFTSWERDNEALMHVRREEGGLRRIVRVRIHARSQLGRSDCSPT